MKIAVCDDSIEDLLKIENLLLQYKTLYPGRYFELETFSEPSVLYRKIPQEPPADIYILDMLMPKRTGIDIGNQIRKTGNESIIIYITSSDDYALDAYGVHAARYLLKPIDENKLFEALDYSLSHVREKTEPLYLLKTKNGLIQTPYSRIEYIENVNRKLEMHLSDGAVLESLFIRKSFEEEILAFSEMQNFKQIHKSFLVNLDYVKQLTSDSIVVESGRRLPVSKSRSAKVKREYLLYVSGKYK